MSTLQLRKQLLVAESELNRAHIAGDIAVLTAEARAMAARAKSIGSIASSAALLLGVFAASRRRPPTDTVAKPSWLHKVLKGAGLVSSLWLAIQSKQRPLKSREPATRE